MKKSNRIFAVEIKDKKAIFVCLEQDEDGQIQDITGKMLTLSINDDESSEVINSFLDLLYGHLDQLNPDKIGIIKRTKRGPFSGSAESFKLEALIQSYNTVMTELVSPQTIRAFLKKNPSKITPKYKYQENAYKLALYLIDLGAKKESKKSQ